MLQLISKWGSQAKYITFNEWTTILRAHLGYFGNATVEVVHQNLQVHVAMDQQNNGRYIRLCAMGSMPFIARTNQLSSELTSHDLFGKSNSARYIDCDQIFRKTDRR